ncbi:MAG: hypothetical protein M1165_01715 [Candidatus Pacearchaeota archaeon]|nr:hypothetical protein [Candidatus Pacearchaeota archaeon]
MHLSKILTYLIFIPLMLFLIMFAIPETSADDYYNSTVSVSVNLVEPVARVEISPDVIDLGNITKGYSTNYANLTFNNTGNFDIEIHPVLENNSSGIFNYLEFNAASCSTSSSSGWYNMSYYSNMSKVLLSIDKPEIYGGQNKDYACLRLNLQKYNNTILPGETGLLSANVTFWIMPQ